MLNLLHHQFKPSFFSILGSDFTDQDYVTINLSDAKTAKLGLDLSNEYDLQDYIDEYLRIHKAKAAYGGYLEKRSLYNRSPHFKKKNLFHTRNIHLGLDVWAPEGTAVYSPLPGKIHSQQDNLSVGDYGPTLILEHSFDGFRFYTLYGHLSKVALNNFNTGEDIQINQPIAQLGDASENGNYPPHLHFQIIMDIQDYSGDYPGVSSQADLEFYKENCPDPNLIFSLKS